ncbi:hypothetical protein DENSPDRAFT_865924, partial [Dentipellis sp. KUC8613]
MASRTFHCNCTTACGGVNTLVSRRAYYDHARFREADIRTRLDAFLDREGIDTPSQASQLQTVPADANASDRAVVRVTRMSAGTGEGSMHAALQTDVDMEDTGISFGETSMDSEPTDVEEAQVRMRKTPEAVGGNDNDLHRAAKRARMAGSRQIISDVEGELGSAGQLDTGSENDEGDDPTDLADPGSIADIGSDKSWDIEASLAAAMDDLRAHETQEDVADDADAELLLGPPPPLETLHGDENVSGDTPRGFMAAEVKTAMAFIELLQDATLEKSGLDTDSINRLRNPPECLLDLSDPALCYSIDLFLSVSNASEKTYNDARNAYLRRHPEEEVLGYEQVKHQVAELSGVTPIPTDMCPNSCIAYTGPYASLETCPYCFEPRYILQSGSSRSRCPAPRRIYHTIPVGP